MKAHKPDLATALVDAARRWFTGEVACATNTAAHWTTPYTWSADKSWNRPSTSAPISASTKR